MTIIDLLEKNSLESKIKPLKACFDSYLDIENLGKTKLGGKVVLSADEASKLKQQACSYWSAKTIATQAEEEKNAMHNKYGSMDSKFERLSRENVMLKTENQGLKRQLDHIENVLESNPELMEMFNKQSEQLTQEALQSLYMDNNINFSL